MNYLSTGTGSTASKKKAIVLQLVTTVVLLASTSTTPVAFSQKGPEKNIPKAFFFA